MYLLNITNLDYLMMTLLFGGMFVCAYTFRRKNTSHEDFFFYRDNSNYLTAISLAGIGIIEFVLLSSYGAYAGLGGLIIAIPIYILLEQLAQFLVRRSLFFKQIISAKFNPHTGVILVIYIVVLLLASGIAIAIVVSLLKSLLGWEFANSTLSLLAIAAVCLLLGGAGGLNYNKLIISLVTLCILGLITVLAYNNIGVGNLVANLKQVAADNQLPANYFIWLNNADNIVMQLWLGLLAAMALVVINPFLLIHKFIHHAKPARAKYFLAGIFKFILIVLVIFSGILALATKTAHSTINGKQVVTLQTRLDNGELGYIVKTVPGNQATIERGIIPIKAANDDEATLHNHSSGNFDFIAASPLLIKKSLPFAFISLFIIVALFFKTISDNILFATLLIIRGIYAPRFNKSGEELENLWASRVFMFALFVVAICVGLVLFKFMSLYYMLGLLLILCGPLLISACCGGGKWWLDLILYLLIAGLIVVADVQGELAILPLWKFENLADMVAKISLIAILAALVLYLPGFCTMRKNEKY